MTFLGKFIVRMHLYGEVLARVDELDEEREGIAEFLIDAFSDEQTFVLIDELCEIQPEIDISDDTSFHRHRLMSGHGADLPRLADIGLRGVNTLERGYLITTPDGGF